jgi:glutathione S-transferase
VKIYDRKGFPNPIRVRAVVAAKGLESQIEWVSVDLIAAEHKQPPFLAKNPSGVVPVLELDDGTFISESTAITEYLDNLDGNPNLTATTPLERAIVLMMQHRTEAYVIEPVGIFFHYGTPGWGTELPKYKAPNWKARGEWARREAVTVTTPRRKCVRASCSSAIAGSPSSPWRIALPCWPTISDRTKSCGRPITRIRTGSSRARRK